MKVRCVCQRKKWTVAGGEETDLDPLQSDEKAANQLLGSCSVAYPAD